MWQFGLHRNRRERRRTASCQARASRHRESEGVCLVGHPHDDVEHGAALRHVNWRQNHGAAVGLSRFDGCALEHGRRQASQVLLAFDLDLGQARICLRIDRRTGRDTGATVVDRARERAGGAVQGPDTRCLVGT